MATGNELSEDQIGDLEDNVEIASVDDDTVDDEDGKEFTLLLIETFQKENLKYNFQLHVTVELTDWDDHRYFVQATKSQGERNTEYSGDDSWKILIPHGGLDRPAITAYAIRYGIFLNGKFIQLAVEFDDVDSVEELMARNPSPIQQACAFLQQYSYVEVEVLEENEGEEEEVELVYQSEWK